MGVKWVETDISYMSILIHYALKKSTLNSPVRGGAVLLPITQELMQ